MKIATKLNFGGRFFVGTSRAMLVCAAIVFGLAGATPSRAQDQQDMQSALAAASAAARDARTARSSSSSAPITGIAATFEYEVASVKPSNAANTNGFMRMGMRYTDDGVSIENLSLMALFQNAYAVGKERISGAQDWMNSERYDIEAKIDPARVEDFKKLTPDEMKAARQHMLQGLLADRFKLTMHRDTKELAVYNLVVAKGGLKLQESKPEDKKDADGSKAAKDNLAASLGAAKGGSGGPSSVTVGGGGGGGKSVSLGSATGANISFSRGGTRSTTGRGVTIENLVASLANICGRPIIDKTGLTGKYDYKLEYAPEDAQPDPDSNAPSIYTAVQEQLGLKLESAKGPVEIFVIDHVEKPSGN